MNKSKSKAADAPSGRLWLEADQLKQIPIRRVLIAYQLLENLEVDGPTLKGPSLFFPEGRLAVNEEKNVWNDSCGRPQVGGKSVTGNVIGLVQALEGVGFRRALEILHERFQADQDQRTTGTRSALESTLAPPPTPTFSSSSTSVAPSSSPTLPVHSSSPRSASTPTSTTSSDDSSANTPFGRRLVGLKPEVPFLQNAEISTRAAKALGIGWCVRGLFKGRIVFPVCQADQTVVAYVGLDPKAPENTERWRFPSGFHRSLELYGLEQLHGEPRRAQWARSHGLVLVSVPCHLDSERSDAFVSDWRRVLKLRVRALSASSVKREHPEAQSVRGTPPVDAVAGRRSSSAW